MTTLEDGQAPPADIPDEQTRELARLARALANNPETRMTFLRMTKKIDPATPIPELDVLDRVQGAVKPHLEKLEALEKKLLEKEVMEKVSAKRNALRESGHTQADIDAIEKIMVEKQIPDHATAAEFFKMQRQVAQPTPAHLQVTRLPVDKAAIKEAGGIRKWGQNEAHTAIDDLRAGRVRLNS